MLNCQETSRLLYAAPERPPNGRTRFALWLHLRMCHACRRFERQLATIRKGLARLEQGPAGGGDEALSPEARARICASLDARCDHDH